MFSPDNTDLFHALAGRPLSIEAISPLRASVAGEPDAQSPGKLRAKPPAEIGWRSIAPQSRPRWARVGKSCPCRRFYEWAPPGRFATQGTSPPFALIEEGAVDVSAYQDAGAVGMGPALQAELLEGLITAGKCGGDLLQGIRPRPRLGLARQSEGVPQQMSLLAANCVELAAALLTEFVDRLPAILLACATRYPPGPFENISGLADGRSGDAQESGDLTGGLAPAIAQEPENLHLGIRDRLPQGLFDGTIVQNAIYRPRENR